MKIENNSIVTDDKRIPIRDILTKVYRLALDNNLGSEDLEEYYELAGQNKAEQEEFYLKELEKYTELQLMDNGKTIFFKNDMYGFGSLTKEAQDLL